MSAGVRKWLKYTLITVVVLMIALPFIPAELFRSRIQNALEQGLGRKVEIGSVHLTLLPGVLPGPGFLLDQVLIHDDKRAGIEPVAYVEELGASVRLLSLFSRRLEFSTLNIDDATINIVKPASGPWNYQMLLNGAMTNLRALPSIRMRGGRINFKFEDTKALFYFNQADLNFTPYLDGSFDLYFAGVPSRTDRQAMESGRIFVRGTSSADRRLDFRINLEKTELEDAIRWISPGALGVHGTVTMDAQLRGPMTKATVEGNLEIGDVHRWDLLPAEVSRWRMNYQGTLDLTGESLELRTKASDRAPVSGHLTASHWLGSADWDAGFEFREIPFSNLLKIAQHMGGVKPELTGDGALNGSLQFSRSQGLAGKFQVTGATATPGEDAVTLKDPLLAVKIAAGFAKVEKTTIEAGTQNVEIEASYELQPQKLDLKLTTRGLDLSVLRSFGVTGLPVLRESPEGSFRGSARYSATGWTGDLELRDLNVPVEGLAEPVIVESGVLSMNGSRLAVNRMRASAGSVHFTGDYHWEPDQPRPHRFAVQIPETDTAALAAMLTPTLVRDTGLISRTLGIGSTPAAPSWLASRHAEGEVSIGVWRHAETSLRNVAAKVQSDGVFVRLTEVKATFPGGATLSGELTAELSTHVPKTSFSGKLADAPFRGGLVTLEGAGQAGGNVAEYLESLHSTGQIRTRGIALAPGAEFRSATGDYEVNGFGAKSLWKFTNVEADGLKGKATSESDGKLVLDLSSEGRDVKQSVVLFK